MIRIENLSKGRNSNHLNTGLSQVFEWSKVVRFANSPVFKWLGWVITITMLRNCHSYVVPFEIQLNHLKTGH